MLARIRALSCESESQVITDSGTVDVGSIAEGLSEPHPARRHGLRHEARHKTRVGAGEWSDLFLSFLR